MNRAAAVAGIGRTAYTRASGRTTGAMAAEACRAALADAGLGPADVDGMVSFQAGDSTGSLSVAHAIGVDDLTWCLDVFGGGNVAAAVVATADRGRVVGPVERSHRDVVGPDRTEAVVEQRRGAR